MIFTKKSLALKHTYRGYGSFLSQKQTNGTDANLGNNGQEIGRQIDFLIQELNRESNTIGAKSSEVEVSEAVVQMKVQLEKIREQALNLE